MSVTEDLLRFADLCLAGASAAERALDTIGTQPGSPATVQRTKDLYRRIYSLTKLADDLGSDAIINGAQDLTAQLQNLENVTHHAEAEIARIAEISKLMKTLAKVADVGVAIVGMVTPPPTVAKATALAGAIKALGNA